MRIMHLLNHTNRLNGHVHAAVDLACAQAKLGHEVCVASAGGDFDRLLHENGVSSIHIDHTRSPLTIMKSATALYRSVRKFRADIIHAHMMTSAVLAWPVKVIARIPLITTVHNEFEKSAILMGLGNRVIAVSEAVGRSMVRRGIPKSKVLVVLNGTIGSARFANREVGDLSLEYPSVLYVGGLHPRKGLPDLLEAFQIAYDKAGKGRLYIVGAGPFDEQYREMAASLPCANAIEFLGMKEAPYTWMAAADIFVLPSHADPAPLVISEAREARCAVVGSAVDGIPELLENGAAGILVPAKDSASLAEVLTSLMTNPQLIDEWKQNSQISIERMSIDRVALEVLQIYSSARVRRMGEETSLAS